MNVLLGWHIQTIIVVTSVAIVLYSMLGGMKLSFGQRPYRELF